MKLNMPFILGLIYIWSRYMEGSQHGARLWGGDAKYSPTELVLHSPTVNYLFDEDDEEVVFVRQELDEGNLPPEGGGARGSSF